LGKEDVFVSSECGDIPIQLGDMLSSNFEIVLSNRSGGLIVCVLA
jgi:hypothetical protein